MIQETFYVLFEADKLTEKHHAYCNTLRLSIVQLMMSSNEVLLQMNHPQLIIMTLNCTCSYHPAWIYEEGYKKYYIYFYHE